MSHAYSYKDDPNERAAVEAWIKREGLTYRRPREEVIPPSAQILDHPTRRKPLGLAPVPDDPGDPAPADDNMTPDGHVVLAGGYRFSFKDDMSPAFLEAPAVNDFVVELGNACVSIVDTVHRKAKADIAEVRREARSEAARFELENAKLRATVAELTAKVDTLTFISERLRVENTGPIGPQGRMGRDGHDGRPGPRGERGERGEPGSAGAMIVGWRVDGDRHLCTPIYSDNSAGAPLNLSAFVSDEPEADEE
jgi:hypothetical protein